MKIKKVGILIILLLSLFTITSCNKQEDAQKSFPEIISEVKSYKLSGKLETFFPSGTKECEVVVYYQSPSLYRVELTNAGNNEPQIMIKNADGTYVLLPAVNKIFKVNSSWPDNSSYPYILQSLSKDIISDDNIISTKKDNTETLELKAKLFDNATITKQKISFNTSSGLPTEVLVYDDEDTLISRFEYSNIELNYSIDTNLFQVNESMSAARLVYAEDPFVFDRLISYPTFFPDGTSLDQENTSGIGDGRRVIMKYSGESPFTIVEQLITQTENTKTEYLTGSIYTMGGAMCIVSNNTIFFYDGGIEYLVASTSLNYTTMIQMGESLRTANSK